MIGAFHNAWKRKGNVIGGKGDICNECDATSHQHEDWIMNAGNRKTYVLDVKSQCAVG